MTIACAEERKLGGVHVNAIDPGRADTNLKALIQQERAHMLKVEDSIRGCIFRAKNEAQYITSQVYPVEWFGSEAQAS